MFSRWILFGLTGLSLLIISALPGTTSAAPSEKMVLDNGLEVIMVEKHASPMIATVIFVRSGAKYETTYENGITHFLEHLLFNGTATMTREELDASISDLGGYINAFTRKDLTAFLVLLPRQYIDYGMTVQADMLFNSVFPEEELEKERKVVLEEIAQSADAAGAPAEAFFTERAYDGTDYARPVLGYRPFIENIPREAIIHYWKQYYKPANMTMLVIGDFNTDSMKTVVSDIFGRFDNPPIVADTLAAVDSSGVQMPTETKEPVPVEQAVLTGQSIHDTVAAVTSTYIDVSFPAPQFNDSGYLAMDLLSRYLAIEDISPLKKALLSGAEPLASEVSVSLRTYEEFSRLEVSVISDHADRRKLVVDSILAILGRMAGQIADPETLEGIKTSVKCNQYYYEEKLHYYGFMIAPMMMTAGWDWLTDYPDLLQQVQWSQCQTVAATWLKNPSYVTTMVRPAEDSIDVPYLPQEMAADDVITHFANATFPLYELRAGHEMQYPQPDSVKFTLEDPAEYHREVFDNGLTVIVRSSPDSRVFAVNVLGKNRSAMEPDSLAGITDLVNRCLEHGTLSRSSAQLSRDLARIGANVTLYDNPWIPYDDRYTTRQYSFFKFETIDEYASRGLGLLLDMLLYPAFDSSEVENARRSMLSVIGRQSASPRNTARDLFYRTLFAGGPYAKAIMGDAATVGTITAEDLRAHHARMYSPGNMIVTVSTRRPVTEITSWLKSTLGRTMPVDLPQPEISAPEPVLSSRTAHTDLDKEQVYLYLGSQLPDASSPDAVALQVATSILSERLYLNLREKQGLAYSVGAGAKLDRDFGWYYCSIGTTPSNFQNAIDGIILQMEKLRLDGPTPDEIKRARNGIWGRLMSSKLSRINQAYYLGLNEYLDRPVDHDRLLLESLETVGFEQVRRVATRYFRTDAYVLTTAGSRP